MCVDITHLVLEAFGDANNEIVEKRPHRPESGNRLARAMVDLHRDEVLLGRREVDIDVAEVLSENT